MTEQELFEQIEEHRKRMNELSDELREIKFSKEGYEKCTEEEVLEKLRHGEILRTPYGSFFLMYDNKFRKLCIFNEGDTLQISLYQGLSLERTNFVKETENSDLIKLIVSIKDTTL